MYFVLRCAVAAALLVSAVNAAGKPLSTVNQVITLVRAELAAKKSDKQIVKDLSKLTLGERLEPVVVEHLESEGAGPQTVEELEQLALATEDRAAPTPPPAFPHPPFPTTAEQQAAINHAGAYARSYAANLPDFLCDETVVRYEDLRASGVWQKRDALGIRLSYGEKAEDERLVTYNGRPTTASLREYGGAIIQGEFGSLMIQILDPTSHGKFHWDHWTLLRNHLVGVYSYRIEARDSQYHLVFGQGFDHEETTPAMEGFLYLDGETNDIVRIFNRAADIPPTFAVRQAINRVDYAPQAVGDKRYVLPLRSESRMAARDIRTRNLTEFGGYRKFEGKSSISFGDAEPDPPKIKH